MPLTDSGVRRAHSRDKLCNMADGAGPYMPITTNGSKHGRMKSRFDEFEKKIRCGPYPRVALQHCRLGSDRRDQRVHRSGVGGKNLLEELEVPGAAGTDLGATRFGSPRDDRNPRSAGPRSPCGPADAARPRMRVTRLIPAACFRAGMRCLE